MQWPVYSLAEHASEIIRAFHNGVADPTDSNTPTSGGNSTDTNNNGTGDNNAAFSLYTPSVLTGVVALLFAVFAVVL